MARPIYPWTQYQHGHVISYFDTPSLPIQTQQLVHIPPRINPNPLGQPLGPPPRRTPTHPLIPRRTPASHTKPTPHATRKATRALRTVRCRIPRPPHQKRFTQLVGIELAGAVP